MTEDEFRALAGTYGADLARWPERLRPAAVAATRQPWAGAILSEAAHLDALLALPADVVSARRVDRAIAAVNVRIAEASGQPTRRRWLWPLLAPATGMAAAGILGAWLGFSGVQPMGGAEAGLVELLAMTMSYGDPAFLLIGG